ncbi:hypothetical protein TKK_0005592 [Trichogramma kaykai]
MEAYMALFDAIRVQRESARDPAWASDLTNTKICLIEYQSELTDIIDARLRRINRKILHDGINVAASFVDFRLPFLFHNGEPVKILKLYNIQCHMRSDRILQMLRDAGIHTCSLTAVKSAAHSTTAKVACPTLALSCRLQLIAILKKVAWTKYSASLQDDDKFIAVQPILKPILPSAIIPSIAQATQVLDADPLLVKLAENYDLAEYLSRFLSCEDIANAWLLCRNKNLVTLLMKRRVDASRSGFIGQNTRQMVKDYIVRYQPKEIIFSDRGLIREASAAIKTLNAPSNVLPYQLKRMDLSDLMLNSQLIDLVARTFVIDELIVGKSSHELRAAFSRIRTRQLRVFGNRHLQGDFLRESVARVESLTLCDCGEVACRPIIDFLRDNLIIKQVKLNKCSFLVNSQPEAMLLLLEAIVSDNAYVESLAISYDQRVDERPFDGQFINLSSNLTLKEVDFSNNADVSKIIPNIVLYISNVKMLDLSGVPLVDYIDFSELCVIESLNISYSQYLAVSLQSLVSLSFRELRVENHLGKSKTKLLDLNCIEHLTYVKDFVYKFIKCKIAVRFPLERRIKNEEIELSRDGIIDTLSRES